MAPPVKRWRDPYRDRRGRSVHRDGADTPRLPATSAAPASIDGRTPRAPFPLLPAAPAFWTAPD